MKKAAGKTKQYSENDTILKTQKMAPFCKGYIALQNVQLEMKEKGNKKETKLAFENKQGLLYHKKEARKVPFL